MTTFPLIPQVARISLSPAGAGSSAVLRARFLLGGRTAFASPVALEMASFQVTELGEFIEGDVIDGSDLLSYGFIEVKNLPMGAGLNGCEIGGNVIIVFFKFSFTMWENESRCLEDSSPCDNPISVRFNGFGGF
jgi:hypothetical protein